MSLWRSYKCNKDMLRGYSCNICLCGIWLNVRNTCGKQQLRLVGTRAGRFGSKVGQIHAKCTEIWAEKVPDLSHLGSIWPTLEPNLPSLVSRPEISSCGFSLLLIANHLLIHFTAPVPAVSHRQTEETNTFSVCLSVCLA